MSVSVITMPVSVITMPVSVSNRLDAQGLK